MTIELLFVLFSGLVFGSFITCASYRLPLEMDVVKKPSHCPACGTHLKFLDLWPVFSWVISKGKCRYCGAHVSPRYPMIELATGALFALIYLKYGLSLPSILLMLMGVALLIMIVVDLEHTIIPDEVHLALLPLALGYHAAIGASWESVAGGFAFGLGLGLLLHHGYRWVRKKDGLGYGDVKFFAVAGAWLTFMPFVPFMLIAGLCGIAMGVLWRALGKGAIYPFGPSLAAALFICVVFPESVNWFWSLGGSLR